MVDTIDTGGDLSNTPDLGGDMMATGRALSSGDEAWVVPMLVISAISVSVITIYQVSLIITLPPSNILVFQVVIIVRSYRSSPSRRHLFLSQVLLLGDYDRNLPVTFSNSNAVFVLSVLWGFKGGWRHKSSKFPRFIES